MYLYIAHRSVHYIQISWHISNLNVYMIFIYTHQWFYMYAPINMSQWARNKVEISWHMNKWKWHYVLFFIYPQIILLCMLPIYMPQCTRTGPDNSLADHQSFTVLNTSPDINSNYIVKEFDNVPLSMLMPEQNGHQFAGNIFKCVFLDKNVYILIWISLKFVDKSALVQTMAWHLNVLFQMASLGHNELRLRSPWSQATQKWQPCITDSSTFLMLRGQVISSPAIDCAV